MLTPNPQGKGEDALWEHGKKNGEERFNFQTGIQLKPLGGDTGGKRWITKRASIIGIKGEGEDKILGIMGRILP